MISGYNQQQGIHYSEEYNGDRWGYMDEYNQQTGLYHGDLYRCI